MLKLTIINTTCALLLGQVVLAVQPPVDNLFAEAEKYFRKPAILQDMSKIDACYQRPLAGIIDKYPRFGIESGARLPLENEEYFRKMRFQRASLYRSFQGAMDRFATLQRPPRFPHPIYTLAPDVPFINFVRYLVQCKTMGDRDNPGLHWLETKMESVVSSIEALLAYSRRKRIYRQTASTAPSSRMFKEWYQRLMQFGLGPYVARDVFYKVPQAWIPDFPILPETVRCEALFIYHQLLVVRIIQTALQHPRYVDDSINEDDLPKPTPTKEPINFGESKGKRPADGHVVQVSDR